VDVCATLVIDGILVSDGMGVTTTEVPASQLTELHFVQSRESLAEAVGTFRQSLHGASATLAAAEMSSPRAVDGG